MTNQLSETPIKLSKQESEVLHYLQDKEKVYWEELAQFSKDPTTIKLKSVQKIVSTLRKKYQEANRELPFKCAFNSLDKPNTSSPPQETVEFNGQKLVKLNKRNQPKSTPTPCLTVSEATTITQTDFTIKPFTRQIITKSGLFTVAEEEFQIFNYLYERRGKIVSLEELRDEICFPKFGSKLPTRWFFAIQRRVNNIRRQIPEAKAKILTVKTGYLVQHI